MVMGCVNCLIQNELGDKEISGCGEFEVVYLSRYRSTEQPTIIHTAHTTPMFVPRAINQHRPPTHSFAMMQALDVGQFLKLDQSAIAALHLFPVHKTHSTLTLTITR